MKNILFNSLLLGSFAAFLAGCGKSDLKPSASGPAAKPEPPALQKVLNDALTDSLAAEVREQLHPTGKGGKLGSKSVTCSDAGERCTAKFEVRWKGGILGSDYVSKLSWTITDKESIVTVDAETSMLAADQEHIKSLQDRLAVVAHRSAQVPERAAPPVARPGASSSPASTPPSAAPAAAASVPSSPEQRIEAYAAKARKHADFLALPFWAVRPQGTMSCDGKTKLSEPNVDDGADESDAFKRHEKQEAAKAEREKELGKRDEYRRSIIDSLVYVTEALDLSPAELGESLPDSDVGSNRETPFDVAISEYDFNKSQYTITLRPMATTGWAIGVDKPVIRDETVSGSIAGSRRAGVTIGGREVRVRTSEGFAYQIARNHSRMDVALRLPTDVAKVLAERCKRKGLFSGFKGCDGKLRLLQRITSVGYHKVCNGDDPWDNSYGIGDLYNAKTLAVEVEIDGQWTATWYDEAELAKL